MVFLNIFLGGSNRLLDSQSVEAELRAGRVANDTFFGIITLFAHISSLYQWDDRQIEMFGKSIVTTVVSRNSHNGACSVSSQNIIAHPNRNLLICKGIDGITACKYTSYTAVADTIALCALLGSSDIVFYFLAMFVGSYFFYIFTFRRQHHEGNTKHRVGTCGKDGEMHVAVGHIEFYFRTFAATNPVALGLFQRVCPIDGIQTVQQTLCISTHTKAPLTHLLLNDRESATNAHAVNNLVIGQNRTQSGTPVHHRLTQIGNTVVHQSVLLFFFAHTQPFLSREHIFFATGNIEIQRSVFTKMTTQIFYRHRFLQTVVVVRVEHLHKCPLRPFVIDGFTGTYFPVPIEAETDFIQLLTIAVDVFVGRLFWVLTRLNSILFGRKSVGIITHRIQNIEALQPLVASIDIAGDISQGMTNMQSCSRRIREHVQNIELLFTFVFRNLVGLHFHPPFLPFLFNLFEVVFHC